MNILQKIENLFLLMFCMIRFCFYGKADDLSHNIKNILIVAVGKLGDVVCTTPVFSAIRKEDSDIQIFVEDSGGVNNEEILANSGLVDGYIKSKNFFLLRREIKENKIDTVCITGLNAKTVAYMYLVGVKTIVTSVVQNGFSPQQTKTFNFLKKFVIQVPFTIGEYAPRERLRVLEPFGIFATDTKKKLGFSKSAELRVKNYFIKNDIKVEDLIIGISPSAGNKIKKWGAEKFAKLADYIYQKYKAKIIITGGGRDREEVIEMIRFLNKDTKFFNTLNMFNIDELKSVISKMNIFISVDTGPIYIAEAFGVATVDITGPIDENEQPPISDIHRVVNIKNRNKPELYVMNARKYNEKEALRQINEITVEMVTKEIDNLYGYIKF